MRPNFVSDDEYRQTHQRRRVWEVSWIYAHRARASWCEGLVRGVQKQDERWSEMWDDLENGFVWSSQDARDEDEW